MALKILLICFSQTGNTKKIADCIKEGVLDVLPHCDMCDMEQAGAEDLDDYDLVGLGCPVFYYQEPCVYCWRCVNICPERAIQADWDRLVEMAPKLYERYRYWLDRAAEKWLFRWRVDPDNIDFDRPYYLRKKDS